MPKIKAPKDLRCNYCGIFIYKDEDCFGDFYLDEKNPDYYCLRCGL